MKYIFRMKKSICYRNYRTAEFLLNVSTTNKCLSILPLTLSNLPPQDDRPVCARLLEILKFVNKNMKIFTQP